MTEPYRPELPEVPLRMRSLPIRRGYPVPWFVAMVPSEGGEDYHFPTADARKLVSALNKRLCWVCGQPLGSWLTFVIGPMCAVNRITSEPPCHKECAIFSATACPFLSRPHMKRQKGEVPGAQPPPGIYIERNPGVTCVWLTREYWIKRVPDGRGFLFNIGDPKEVLWFAEGREATREEVLHSLSTGLPILHDAATQDGGDALKMLDRCYTAALRLVPA